MTCGEKIAFLRKSKGMTQSELGEKLNVTFQAVSKWERGESYPDFDTLSKIAKIFEKPISYFENEDTVASEQNDATTQEVQIDQTTERVMLGVCKDCGRVVYKGDEARTTPSILCNSCHKKQIEKQQEEARQKRHAAMLAKQEVLKMRNRGLIWSAVITAVFIVACIVVAIFAKNALYLVGIASAVLLVYPFVAQLFWDGIVVEICEWGGAVIGTPGVIFELDLDGIIFLVAVKILFAVLRFIVWLVTILLAAIVAMIVAPFSFFPQISKLNDGEEL